jgi:hypothetical protein
VHGGRGEALTERGEMEGGKDKGKKEEPLDPIMMDDDQIKWILATTGKTRSGVPYQYKVNTKKRVVAMREGLASDEEEVEDLRAVEKIEEILHATYERKTRGPRMGREGNNPIHINVSVEPINPCATNTPKRTPPFRQPKFGRSQTVGSTSTQGETTGGASSGSTSQVSTPRGGSSSTFRMAGHDPTIRLPEFKGEASEDPEKHLFICEKIWEEKQITDEDTKLAQLAITLRDHALDWYMSLATNNPPGTTRTIADIKKLLINEFQKPSSEDQYMNEMIEIRQKLGESVWEIDQRFKRLKGKLKYLMTDMQHRHLFVNSLLPHLKYPLRQQKFQTQAEALQAALQLEENQYQQTDPTIEELKEDLKNLTFQLNQNKNKDKREVVWCTTCRTEGHHKNECPTFTQYMAAGMPNPLPTGGLWCEICKKPGHDPYHCSMMQKYQTVPKSSYCNFCKSVGHDDKDCRTMELMRERTSDAYRVQAEMMTGQATPQFNQVPAPYNTAQQQYNTAQQPYNTAQPQYNTTQPQYNTTQYNQAPQYNAPRGDRAGYRGGGRARGGFG